LRAAELAAANKELEAFALAFTAQQFG
jgi:hypothetical protein